MLGSKGLNHLRRFLALCALFFNCGGAPASAHTTSLSYCEISIHETQVAAQLRLNLYELDFAAQLDKNADLRLGDDEVRNGFDLLADRLLANFGVKSAGETGESQLRDLSFSANTGETECSLLFSFSRRLEEEVKFKVTLHNISDSGHWNLAQFRYDGQQEQRFFNLENPETEIELRRGWTSYLKLGTRFLYFSIRSFLNEYEYLAFLIALLVVGGTLGSRVKAAGALLLGHTATFVLGVNGALSLPPRFIDSAVALGVAYIAVENLILKEATNRWLIACFFGLIYGFDFSSAIKDWGLPRKGLIVSLIFFNLGTILGVMTITVLMAWVMNRLTRLQRQRVATTIASVGLMTMGFFWFVKRTL